MTGISISCAPIRVHLLADDPDDLQPDPLAERQQRIMPGHQLGGM